MRVVTLQARELELLRFVAAAPPVESLRGGGEVAWMCDTLAGYGLLALVQGCWTITPRGHRTVARLADVPPGADVQVPVFDAKPIRQPGE